MTTTRSLVSLLLLPLLQSSPLFPLLPSLPIPPLLTEDWEEEKEEEA